MDFADIVKAIQRFEDAVLEYHTTRMFSYNKVPVADHREREYESARTEMLNLVGRYGKGVNGND